MREHVNVEEAVDRRLAGERRVVSRERLRHAERAALLKRLRREIARRERARRGEGIRRHGIGYRRRARERHRLARPVVERDGALARHRGIARGEVESRQVAVRHGQFTEMDALGARSERANDSRRLGIEAALASIRSVESERIRGEGTVVDDVCIVRNRHALGRERTRLIDVSVDRERINVGSTRIRERAVNRGRGDIERLAVMDERAVHIKRIARPGTGVRQLSTRRHRCGLGIHRARIGSRAVEHKGFGGDRARGRCIHVVDREGVGIDRAGVIERTHRHRMGFNRAEVVDGSLFEGRRLEGGGHLGVILVGNGQRAVAGEGFNRKDAVLDVHRAVVRDGGELAFRAEGLAIGTHREGCAFAHVNRTVGEHEVVDVAHALRLFIDADQDEFRILTTDEETVGHTRNIHEAHGLREVVRIRNGRISSPDDEFRVLKVGPGLVGIDERFTGEDRMCGLAALRGFDAVGNVHRELIDIGSTVEDNFQVAAVVRFELAEHVGCERQGVDLVVEGHRARVEPDAGRHFVLDVAHAHNGVETFDIHDVAGLACADVDALILLHVVKDLVHHRGERAA